MLTIVRIGVLRRRVGLAAAFLATCLAGSLSVGQTTDQRQPTFREQLVLGLQVRRPSEFAYIDAVIDTVNRGELPAQLVTKVFAYSRHQRNRRTRRPIIVFQPALEAVTAKLKIKVAPDPEL